MPFDHITSKRSRYQEEKIDREVNPERYSIETKPCKVCKKDKILLDFDIGSNTCQNCQNLTFFINRTLKPELAVWKSAKSRAKAKGLDFTITVEDVEAVWTNTCPIYLVPLEMHQGKAQDNSYSIDRIDNTKGYVPGNIAIVSHRFNSEKRNLTPDLLRRMLAYMEGRLTF